ATRCLSPSTADFLREGHDLPQGDEQTIASANSGIYWVMNVSTRGRASWLFDFEYLWEVYKPAAKRRWGYYTLPILYGDRLVARLDPKLDRTTSTLVINGFWLEEYAPVECPGFAAALARGLV